MGDMLPLPTMGPCSIFSHKAILAPASKAEHCKQEQPEGKEKGGEVEEMLWVEGSAC